VLKVFRVEDGTLAESVSHNMFPPLPYYRYQIRNGAANKVCNPADAANTFCNSAEISPCLFWVEIVLTNHACYASRSKELGPHGKR